MDDQLAARLPGGAVVAEPFAGHVHARLLGDLGDFLDKALSCLWKMRKFAVSATSQPRGYWPRCFRPTDATSARRLGRRGLLPLIDRQQYVLGRLVQNGAMATAPSTCCRSSASDLSGKAGLVELLNGIAQHTVGPVFAAIGNAVGIELAGLFVEMSRAGP